MSPPSLLPILLPGFPCSTFSVCLRIFLLRHSPCIIPRPRSCLYSLYSSASISCRLLSYASAPYFYHFFLLHLFPCLSLPQSVDSFARYPSSRISSSLRYSSYFCILNLLNLKALLGLILCQLHVHSLPLQN